MPKDFCSPENISVIIPYKTYEKLVQTANNYEALEKRMKCLEEKHTALTGIYGEVLEKLGEIQRQL